MSSITTEERYIVITAYSITSIDYTNGVCVTTAGERHMLATPFSIHNTANDPDFLVAESSFQAYLNFSDCSGGGNVGPTPSPNLTRASSNTPALVSAYVLVSAWNSSSSSLSSSPPSSSSSTSGRTDFPYSSNTGHTGELSTTPAKAGVAVGISVAALLFMILIIVMWRHKARRERITGLRAGEEKTSEESPQPYLQPKAELEDDERRRHELESTEHRYELEGQGEVVEMTGINESQGRSVSRL